MSDRYLDRAGREPLIRSSAPISKTCPAPSRMSFSPSRLLFLAACSRSAAAARGGFCGTIWLSVCSSKLTDLPRARHAIALRFASTRRSYPKPSHPKTGFTNDAEESSAGRHLRVRVDRRSSSNNVAIRHRVGAGRADWRISVAARQETRTTGGTARPATGSAAAAS
jgi:hypothetical protein